MGKEALLRMNDFPEKPLYTLSFEGQEIDFNEKPPRWTIPWSERSSET